MTILTLAILGVTIYLLGNLWIIFPKITSLDKNMILAALIGIVMVLVQLFVFQLPQFIPDGVYDEYTTVTAPNGKEYKVMVTFKVETFEYDYDNGDSMGTYNKAVYAPIIIWWSNGGHLRTDEPDYIAYDKNNFGNEANFTVHDGEEEYCVVLPEIPVTLTTKLLSLGLFDKIVYGLCLVCSLSSILFYIFSKIKEDGKRE